MKWTPEDVTRAVEVLSRHSSIVEAVAEMRAWRGGLSKDALRKALELHGKLSPSAYLGTAVDEPEPTTARSAREVFLAAPKSVEPARSERWREPSGNPGELPRALWDAPGELPQQHAADRTFIAPLDPVVTLGQPGETGLGIPDVHSPYHSRLKMRFALRCVEATRPDWVIVYGDFADFYTVSFHDRSPGRVSRLADELEVTCELLRAIEKAAPNAKRVFCEGNHENRLSRFVMKHAAALQGLRGLSLDEMLGLSENGWRVVPYREMVIFGGVAVSHDFEHAGVNSSRQSMLSMMSSVSNGHTHRAQSIIQRTLSGQSLVSHSFGWLGEPATVDYRHRRKAALEWSHGLGFGAISDCGVWQAQQVDLNGDSTVIGGEKVRAR